MRNAGVEGKEYNDCAINTGVCKVDSAYTMYATPLIVQPRSYELFV